MLTSGQLLASVGMPDFSDVLGQPDKVGQRGCKDERALAQQAPEPGCPQIGMAPSSFIVSSSDAGQAVGSSRPSNVRA